jgi:dCMP deaminase
MRKRTIRAIKIKKIKKLKRLDTDEYFLKIASVVAERATCRRHHIGAIAVRDKHILATGYNGAPSGFKDCLELGCLRDELNLQSAEKPEICRGVHAEQNVIIQATLHGVSLEGSTIYATHTPCNQCAKMLVNAKIKRYVSYNKYDDTTLRAFVNLRGFVDLFGEAGIEVDIKERPPAEINYLD